MANDKEKKEKKEKKPTPAVRYEPIDWTSTVMDEYSDVEVDGVPGLKALGLVV